MSPYPLRRIRMHGSDHAPPEPSELQEPGTESKKNAKKKKALAVAIVVVLAAVGAGVRLIERYDGGQRATDTSSEAARARTVAVVRTDLADTLTLNGTLGYGQSVPVRGGKDGVVTQLPGVGATVVRGESLYRVDDRPVPVFYGSTPLFRTLDTKGVAGRDVKVIADNLRALGYAVGSQPASGTWIDLPVQQTASAQKGATQKVPVEADASPSASASASAAPGKGAPVDPVPSTVRTKLKPGEAVLTASLIRALKAWQTHVGMPPTGVLGVGDVMVTGGAVRVGAVQAHSGDPATGPLLSVTSTRKMVTVPVEATEAGSINQGDKAILVLPDASTTPGTVSAISTTVQSGDAGGDDDSGASARVNVTVFLDDAKAVGRLNSASVQVRFSAQTRKGVLAVPVGALLALSGGGYAVQLADGRLVAVRTGLFAKGQVEISATGIGPGTKVVTTS